MIDDESSTPIPKNQLDDIVYWFYVNMTLEGQMDQFSSKKEAAD